MKLQLKNIGMIKEANVKIDGLTVIAGENDTGKSTLGKILYIFIKTLGETAKTSNPQLNWCERKFNSYIKSLFNNQISKDGSINFIENSNKFKIDIKNNRCKSFILPYKEYKNLAQTINRPILIETPFIWSIHPILRTIRNINAHSGNLINGIDFEVTPIIEDLYFALTTKMKEKENFSLNIQDIIGGKFEEKGLGDFIFKQNNKEIQLINIAMGIKYFGLLQVLEEKNHLYNGQILILDEPEVHLHPKWQLELAKIIVELVKNGVKIVVNSHSPYMIEALKRYSEVEEIEDKTNFYLAEDGYIKQIENSNSLILEKIFEKLSEPFDVFDEMDSNSLENLING